MIRDREIGARADEWGLRADVVEKDYLLGWVLWGIGSDPVLGDGWVFKGGTCLKKCYLETFRFSEDLDFTVLPSGISSEEHVLAALGNMLRRVQGESGIDFSVREPRLRRRPNDSWEGRIYYKGPRGSPSPASVRIDLTVREAVIRPPAIRPIQHLYPDGLPAPATVRCYALEEVFAEKLRAMGERGRPRDLYDIVFLLGHPGLARHPQLVYETLVAKCESKGVQIPTLVSLQEAVHRAELESEWENMLRHQLPVLAPLEHYWDQLPELFAWLTSTKPPPLLASVSSAAEEQVWEPSPASWTWGAGPRLGPVRFAGANRLLVDLGYQGSVRRIEPYSLRTTRDGSLLLYGIRVDNRQLRAYRVDRIESIAVTTEPFRPRFRVEFASTGDMYAPATQTRTRTMFRSVADKP
ncbi:MAG: nucleotidyl transferase AbiEii/AbiGii toxin family protein [Actinomycetota bacterium]